MKVFYVTQIIDTVVYMFWSYPNFSGDTRQTKITFFDCGTSSQVNTKIGVKLKEMPTQLFQSIFLILINQ